MKVIITRMVARPLSNTRSKRICHALLGMLLCASGSLSLALEQGAGSQSGAIAMLQAAVVDIETAAGGSSPDLIEPLQALARGLLASADEEERIQALKVFDRVVALSADHRGSKSEQHADLQYEIGKQLYRGHGYIDAEKYLQRAIKIYTKSLGQHSKKVALANYLLGKVYVTHKMGRKGIKYLKRVVGYFDKAGTEAKLDQRYLVASHKLIARLYYGMGKQKSANKHFQLVAMAQPWSPDTKPVVLYRQKLNYPMEAFAHYGGDGYVTLEFTIGGKGDVRDAKVVDMEGHHSFTNEALTAIKKWRFVPQYKDGEFVETDNVVWTLKFKHKG